MLIDLNADLGESFGAWHLGHDQALMASITSANVACRFHRHRACCARRSRWRRQTASLSARTLA